MLHRKESRVAQVMATAAPVAIVILFALLTARALRNGASTRAELDRIHRIAFRSERILQRVVDAETAQRGFTVTGDTVFLQPLHGARAGVDADLQMLSRLAVGPRERERVRALAPAVEAVFASVHDNVEIRRGRAASRPDVGARLLRGKALMDQVRAGVAGLQNEVRDRWRVHTAREARTTRLVFAVLVAGGIVSALATLVANLLFARHAAAWKRLAGELDERNEQLQDQAVELEAQSADLQEQSTELEESAEALRRSEHRFRSLIENSSDLITVLARDGTIEYQSPNVQRVLGYAPAALLGTSAFDQVHPDDVAAFRRGLREPTPPGAPSAARSVECRCRHSDGSWRLLEITTSVLPEHAEGRDFVLNSRDVTERRRAEAELNRTEELLRQAAKMEAVGRLAGGVAHDFNNLLTVIGGNAQLLEAEVEPGGHELVVEIAEAARRAAALTRQLLVFSRRDPVAPCTVEVNPVLDGVLGMLRRLISEDIEIHLSLDPRVRAVRVDPGQLEQVVINLAVNASDAMPQGGHLTIETRAVTVEPETLRPGTPERDARPAVLLAVSDTGMGMDAATQARVFDPFFTTKEPGKGTGLGLSTAYGIVQQSGGNVLVDSEPGVGTTFRIYLPEVEPAPRLEPVRPDAEALAGTETILLVEDEPGVRKLLDKVFRQSGYQVLTADSPAEATRVARGFGGRIHLLVTDVVMPGGTGTDLARTLQAERPGMRVLCMSGYTSEAISHHGIVETGIAFIQKPCSPGEIRRVVRELLDEPPRG